MKEKVAVSVVVILVLASFCPAEAQQTTKAMPRIGFISSTGTAESPSPLFEAFRQGLRDLDYVDGKNIVIVHRYAEGRLDRMPPFVHEFVQQKVDVIVGVNNVVIRAAKEATKTIPIVIVSSVDPVAAGYVESFAHPGGNITGLAWLNRDISAKRLELLKELLPKLSRGAILWDADGPGPAVATHPREVDLPDAGTLRATAPLAMANEFSNKPATHAKAHVLMATFLGDCLGIIPSSGD